MCVLTKLKTYQRLNLTFSNIKFSLLKVPFTTNFKITHPLLKLVGSSTVFGSLPQIKSGAMMWTKREERPVGPECKGSFFSFFFIHERSNSTVKHSNLGFISPVFRYVRVTVNKNINCVSLKASYLNL